jgi:hypothetical protein
VTLCHLPAKDAHGIDGGTVDFTECTVPDDDDGGNMVMEAVGYVNGDRSPHNPSIMNTSALAWCLDHKQFVKMQSGSNLVSDMDPELLTLTFPHLDPWGIGSFYEQHQTNIYLLNIRFAIY